MSASVSRKIEPRSGLEVTVGERMDWPGVWTVEAIDMGADGDIYQAFFAGPEAKARAEEYSRMKYRA